ncbi:MAG TPA: hypothetical protein VMA54_20260 [Steroidobacteraceae bacterium]|nr:hypothetical protein [Steroidobacteraceae bacterium]
MTAGLILQELLQGFAGPRARRQIIERFSALPLDTELRQQRIDRAERYGLLTPDRQDYVDAADLRNLCRRSG